MRNADLRLCPSKSKSPREKLVLKTLSPSFLRICLRESDYLPYSVSVGNDRPEAADEHHWRAQSGRRQDVVVDKSVGRVLVQIGNIHSSVFRDFPKSEQMPVKAMTWNKYLKMHP